MNADGPERISGNILQRSILTTGAVVFVDEARQHQSRESVGNPRSGTRIGMHVRLFRYNRLASALSVRGRAPTLLPATVWSRRKLVTGMHHVSCARLSVLLRATIGWFLSGCGQTVHLMSHCGLRGSGIGLRVRNGRRYSCGEVYIHSYSIQDERHAEAVLQHEVA